MSRLLRAFHPEALGLEWRQLLAARPHIYVPPPAVGFTSTAPDGTDQVSQQSDAATVTLWRANSPGTFQVRVATTPSPAVGVNVAAVDQTVTFAKGENNATVTVPIITGAPNPGEVDVELTLNPAQPLTDLAGNEVGGLGIFIGPLVPR